VWPHLEPTRMGTAGATFHAGPDPVWVWAIDTVIPMRENDQMGHGADRKDCQAKFKAAWDKLAADPARLAEFMRMKRARS
jgi:hypothetical protein